MVSPLVREELVQMVHVLAKVAAASGLAAAAATPFTLSAFAGTAPSLPSAPAAPNVSSVTAPVSSAAAQVTSALGLQSVPVSLPAAGQSSNTSSSAAPNSSASADAVSVPLLDTCVSCTSADAGPGSADGNATALRVLSQNISAGSASGNSSNSGDLFALPANPLLSLAVADWMAAAQAGDTSSNGSSRASLVDLALGNGQIATLAVLEAGSNASWTPAASNGNGYANGVHLNVGNGALVVILLHSDADSSAGQHAYVASINGTSILSSTQVGQLPPITIPGVITITLLQTSANGGLAVGSVATASGLLGMPGQQLGLITASGQGAGSNGGPGAGVEAVSTGSEFGSPGTPETGIGIGILGFLLAAGGAAAALASGVRRQGHSA
jgi:hypothetical protein